MPLRPMGREQIWMLPPTLDELIPADHPARFVDVYLDGLAPGGWAGLGVDTDGDPMGAPAYHPRALLSVGLYGFMTGVRSTRKLESACRDQIPYALAPRRFPQGSCPHRHSWGAYCTSRPMDTSNGSTPALWAISSLIDWRTCEIINVAHICCRITTLLADHRRRSLRCCLTSASGISMSHLRA